MPKRVISDLIAGRPVISGGRQTTVRAACCLMAEKKIGALLVVEANRIAGIFTERDALNKVLAGNLDPDTTTLEQVMVAQPLTIRADKPLAYALYMMAEGGFRHVPVVDADGAPLGMVSSRDALGQDIVDLEHDLKLRDQIESSLGY
jgi:CBS domain-containing protein